MKGETKTRAGFTPGPWKVAESEYRVWVYKDELGHHIADADARVSMPRSEQVANARLIAAAPELLGALELVLSCMDHESLDADPPEARDALHDARDDARAAIHKATEGDR